VFNVANGRARTIARTEVVGASNFGRHSQMMASNVKMKEWFCINKGSRIYTSNRGSVPIEEVVVGDIVWSMGNDREEKEVLGVYKQGFKLALRLATPNRKLEVSYDHPVFVLKRRLEVRKNMPFKKWIGKVEAIEAEKLKIGDYVIVPDGLPLKGQEVCSDEMCKLLGFWLGDGCWKGNMGFNLAIVDYKEDLRTIYKKICQEVLPVRKGCNLSCRETKYNLNFTGVDSEKLKALGFNGKCMSKRVPWWVWNLSRDKILCFLRGFADADGSVDKKGRMVFYSPSLDFSKDIASLLDYLGIRRTNIGKTIPKGANSLGEAYKPHYRIQIGNSIEIGSDRLVKKEKLGEGKKGRKGYHENRLGASIKAIPKGFRVERIKEIKDIGECEVYDLEVEGRHNFICEGIVVHNTALDEKVRPDHIAMHGTRVRIDEMFSMPDGSMLKHPGDWNGSPGQIINCYDSETEVLTEKGYKKFYDLNGEKVATMNPLTRELEYFLPARHFRIPYKGKMIWFKSQSSDIMITPNHTMIYESGKTGEICEQSAANIGVKTAQTIYIPRNVIWKGEDRLKILVGGKEYDTMQFMSFMGWYLSEGSVSLYGKGKSSFKYQIAIGQNPGEKFDELKALLESMFQRVWIGKNKIYIVDEDKLAEELRLGPSWQKYIPEWIKQLAPKYLRQLLDSFCKGDGSIQMLKSHHQPRKLYFTSSPRLADDIAELIIKVGKSPTFHFPKKEDCGRMVKFRNGVYPINHPVIWIFENNSKMFTLSFHNKKQVDYDGEVLCVEMPVNNIINVRRNGKTAWCGNCRCIAVAVIGEVVGAETSAVPQESLMGSAGGMSNCIIRGVVRGHLLKVPKACVDYVRGDDGKWFLNNTEVDMDIAERLNKRGIPPAWKNVIAAVDPEAKVQTIGLDAAGRWQYLYSKRHVSEANVRKFNRVRSFSSDMMGIRDGIFGGIAGNDPLAYALLLEDHTAIRAGSIVDLKAKVKAYGLTTLEKRHVKVYGDKIVFDFVAKSGIPAHYEVADPVLTRWMEKRILGLADTDRIFQFSASDVNQYLKKLAKGKSYTIKDFRTYHGTRIACKELKKYVGQQLTVAQKKKIAGEVSTVVSEFLKNTPAIAKTSYIDPMVWDMIGGLAE